ncbi:MAG: hypothetical protein EXR79_10515 [Myxococcales bacterium]|nr:hypothetical protein [Myxococcales bacterium]
MTVTRRFHPSLATLGLLVALAACNRPLPGSAAPLQATPARPLVPPAPSVKATVPAAPLQPSEYVATNKPDPNCPSCRRGDVVSGPTYHGKPDMPLDTKTLDDVRITLDETTEILEQGVAILEKRAKSPDKALADLEAYRRHDAARIERAFAKAREVKARLRAAGYDQDIPAEVRPYAEEKMRKVLERLDAVRDIYRGRPAVLESFGALFPRGF